MPLIDASRVALGADWAGKHQGQGQQPFESKAQPEPDNAQGSIEDLSGIFSILTACVRDDTMGSQCLVLFVHWVAITEWLGPGRSPWVLPVMPLWTKSLSTWGTESLG